MRIINRVKNASSSLNQKSFARDFTKSQQIKNRLMRYSVADNDNSKICLKSERYLNENDDKSVISNSSKNQNKKFKVKQVGKSVIGHYKRQNIVKNKVDGCNTLAAIKAKNKSRPNTSFDYGKNPEDKGFFITAQARR